MEILLVDLVNASLVPLLCWVRGDPEPSLAWWWWRIVVGDLVLGNGDLGSLARIRAEVVVSTISALDPVFLHTKQDAFLKSPDPLLHPLPVVVHLFVVLDRSFVQDR